MVETVDAKIAFLFQSCKFYKRNQRKISKKTIREHKQNGNKDLNATKGLFKTSLRKFFQRLPPCLVDELKQYSRIDMPPPHPDSQV